MIMFYCYKAGVSAGYYLENLQENFHLLLCPKGAWLFTLKNSRYIFHLLLCPKGAWLFTLKNSR